MVVVTGATGFVGSALVAHFREQGRAFRGIGRDTSRTSGVRAFGDLAKAADAALDDLVRGANAVVHLAGRAHVMRETEVDAEAAYRQANTEATARLARAAVRQGVERFLLASSVKVNGEATPYGKPFRPGDTPDPQDAYARSKLAAEEILRATAIGSSLRILVLRLPLVYGVGVRGNFARLIEAVLAQRLLPVGAIKNRRDLIYVGNLVEAIDAALDAAVPPTGVHFVADAEPVSTPGLVRAIATAWSVKPRIVSVPVPLLSIAGALLWKRDAVARLTGSLEVDAASFREATRWTPRWTLAAALAATAAREARSL